MFGAVRRSVLVLVVFTLVCAGCTRSADSRPDEAPPTVTTTATPADRAIAFKDDFETDPFQRWQPVTKSAWAWKNTDHSHVFALVKNVPLTGAVRAPFNRNLIKGVEVGDFQLDVDLKSTTKDYDNRDLSLMFGYQDAAHMYYCHLGHVESDTSNNVFIVNGKDRTPISTQTSPGTDWGTGWHHARVTRSIGDGSIKVYFDDMTTPAMSAVDKTFTIGQVGIGSFDDTGEFDNVVLRNKIADNRGP